MLLAQYLFVLFYFIQAVFYFLHFFVIENNDIFSKKALLVFWTLAFIRYTISTLFQNDSSESEIQINLLTVITHNLDHSFYQSWWRPESLLMKWMMTVCFHSVCFRTCSKICLIFSIWTTSTFCTKTILADYCWICYFYTILLSMIVETSVVNLSVKITIIAVIINIRCHIMLLMNSELSFSLTWKSE